MITAKELIAGTLNFIPVYKRLPYYSDDDIEVEKKDEDGEMSLCPFRANKYIKKYFGKQNKYTKHLLDNKIIAYDVISKITKIRKNRLKRLLKKSIKKPTINERRQIEMFFNKDYFPELGEYNVKCSKCNKKCKQHYWTDVVFCKYSKI